MLTMLSSAQPDTTSTTCNRFQSRHLPKIATCKQNDYTIYVAGCLPVMVSWADAWDAILIALFLAKDSDRLSLCSFNLDTISLWYSPASADFCNNQNTYVNS